MGGELGSPSPAGFQDFIPVRMLNEFTYCPRLFYYEFVEGLFQESADTVEGSIKHARVDVPTQQKRKHQDGGEVERTTAVMFSSERLKLIAKMDVIEERDGLVSPIDHKKGKPRKKTLIENDKSEDDQDENDDQSEWEAWWTDQIQLCAQALILEDNGKKVGHGYIYYIAVKRRIRVEFTEALRTKTMETIDRARATAWSSQIPAPLVDDPRCARCSLLPICMPEETAFLRASKNGGELRDVERLIPARDDQGVLYFNKQGTTVSKQQGTLVAREMGQKVAEVPLSEIRQVTIFGNVQFTTQALQGLMREGIPVSFLSIYGTFYGMASGLPLKNVHLRKQQFLRF